MNTLRIITDIPVPERDETRGASGLEALVQKVKRNLSSFEVDSAVLAEGMRSSYLLIATTLADLSKTSHSIQIEDVEFTLGIDSEGKVGLFSAFSAAHQSKAGLTFRVRPNKS